MQDGRAGGRHSIQSARSSGWTSLSAQRYFSSKLKEAQIKGSVWNNNNSIAFLDASGSYLKQLTPPIARRYVVLFVLFTWLKIVHVLRLHFFMNCELHHKNKTTMKKKQTHMVTHTH